MFAVLLNIQRLLTFMVSFIHCLHLFLVFLSACTLAAICQLEFIGIYIDRLLVDNKDSAAKNHIRHIGILLQAVSAHRFNNTHEHQ